MYYKKTEDAGSIWIIGLSSSGKTTLAELLAKRLWEKGCPNILLDGNQIRDLFEERLGYDIESRRKQTMRVLRLAKWISGQGILPVVSIIHPFEDDRDKCRKGLKGYFEVYLKCDLKTCIERDAKDVYPVQSRKPRGFNAGMKGKFRKPKEKPRPLGQGLNGVNKAAINKEAKNVVGLDIPYEIPEKPDIVLESDRLSPREMLGLLWTGLEKKFFSKSKVELCAE